MTLTSSRPVQQATISSTAQTLSDLGFSTSQISGTLRAWVTGSGGNLRYFLNGDTPTAGQGHIFEENQTYEIKEGAGNLSIIRQSVDVEVTVELERYV